MPRQSRRIPSWLLVAFAAAFCAGGLWIEAADPFSLWRLAAQWSPGALASAAAAPAVAVQSGMPVVSLTLDDRDLHDPATGLLPNRTRHGRDWERPGSLSYFENGQLQFASGVGVRIHGGATRDRDVKQGFRVFFRRQYGARQFAPGILFSPAAQPIRRLILHNDIRAATGGGWWAFTNPFAYDIATAMGAIAAETKPARFYVNGEDYGVYVLTERFDERYFAAHKTHDAVAPTQRDLDELWAWIQQVEPPVTMEKVRGEVDLESLTRWFLAVAFCATQDPFQSPGQFLDRSRPEGRWFWVNWDMDGSFHQYNTDIYQQVLESIAERRRGRNRAEPRSALLTALLRDDPEYRDYFKRTFLQVMNHRVTKAFLDGRYDYYVEIGEGLRQEHIGYLPRLRTFIDRRPAFFRQITEQWLNVPPSQPVTISAPASVSIAIDGERVENGYEGFYFPDLDVAVDVPAEHRAQFSGWVVNGRLVSDAPSLTFRADRPTVIQALFGDAAPTAAPPEESRAPARAPARLPQVEWRTIPAGSFWMGCVPGDPRCGREENPRHQVTIDEPFEMMAREAAADEYRAFAAATGAAMPRQPTWRSNARHPVVNVTWDEAQAFCGAVGGRLPGEAEWEYAARGGLDGRLFPWGDEFDGHGNGRRRGGADRWLHSAPVGSFVPNAFGLRDMAGNVWEWTASRYTPTLDAEPADEGYELRTVRGGSFDSDPPRLRASARVGLWREGRHNPYVGFRCLRSPALGS